MGEATPYLLEVKTSGNRNARTVRQSRSLDTVQAFLQTDESSMLRGVGPAVRRALVAEEEKHFRHINEAMRSATKDGWSLVEPEPGLLYACISVDGTHGEEGQEAAGRALAERLLGWEVAFYSLSDIRLSNDWAYYYPYVLSLEPDHAASFIAGRMWTAVFIDMARVVSAFEAEQTLCTVMYDAPWRVQVERMAGAGWGRSSVQTTHRGV